MMKIIILAVLPLALVALADRASRIPLGSSREIRSVYF